MAPQPDDNTVVVLVPVPPPPPPPPTTQPYFTRSGDPKRYKTYSSKSSYAKGEDVPQITTILTMATETVTAIGFDPSTTGAQPDQTGNSSSSPSWQGPPPWKKHPPPSAYAAAGAVTASIIFGLALLCGCLLWKKKKNKRKADAMQMAERSSEENGSAKFVAAHVATPASSTSETLQAPRVPPAATLTGSSSSASSTTQTDDQPVILSRTMDQSYYTGIDVSDGMSVADGRSLSYAESQDEPPPPYRPASVPSISRDNSMRQSTGLISDRNSRNSVRQIRSPFDDPEEEEADGEEEPACQDRACQDEPNSRTSPPRRTGSRRSRDALSVVSDVSYDEETRPHSNL